MPKDRASGNKGLVPLLGVVAALLLLAGGMTALSGGFSPPAAALGGPWTLVGADGRQVTDRDFRGRFLLIYFGYASCTDVCPTALGTVQAAMRRLGQRAAEVQPLFISVDPARDTPEAVGHYAQVFGPDLIGLTGNAAQLEAVRREYHVAAVVRRDAGHAEEEIDHTSVLFLVGPDGRTLAPLAADETPARLAHQLSAFLS